MKRLVLIPVVLAACLVIAKEPTVSPSPPPPAALLRVEPFLLQTAYQHEWRKERPWVTEGLIAVVQVDPALLYPRQSLQPILHVGDETPERINVGYPSGIAVLIIPGITDLSSSPVWFSDDALPEQLTVQAISARRMTLPPESLIWFHPASVRAASDSDRSVRVFVNRDHLYRYLGGVVERYAPDEPDLAQRLKLIPAQPVTD